MCVGIKVDTISHKYQKFGLIDLFDANHVQDSKSVYRALKTIEA